MMDNDDDDEPKRELSQKAIALGINFNFFYSSVVRQ